MSSILLSLPELYEKYKVWVSRNPQLASDFETTTKLVSYIIAGKINNSHVLSELVYCLSNLLVLFNDRVINHLRQLEPPSSGDKLKLWLTIVEYCEVLFELSAQRVWGTTGKWLIIISLQIFKCISRMFLVYRHREPIIQTPAIPVLDRSSLRSPDNGGAKDLSRPQPREMSFTLKGTGRVIRRVEASPPLCLRSWKPLAKLECCENEQSLEEVLAGRQLVAETIYVAKPLTHLAALGCFGSQSWKPWLVSLVMDLASLQLYGSCKGTPKDILTKKQRLQISKRTLSLLMYLLRSPFYEKHSKDKINALLISLSRNLPLVNIICTPLAQYLPFWQSVYFYMWST